jgi:hypothetical protein
LAQIVRALVFVVVSCGLGFESPWVQTIPWGQPAGEAGLLPDPCGWDALHGSDVYPIGVGNKVVLLWRGSSVKVHGSYLPSKNALREEGIPWLIKCPGERNLSDVGHFNTRPHVWQLMAKHVDNNRRERPIIARNPWLWYHVKVHEPYSPSKDALRKEGTPWLIKCPGERNLSNVGHFNILVIKKKCKYYFMDAGSGIS